MGAFPLYIMTHEEKYKVWKEALEWQKNKTFVDISDSTDKPDTLLALFRMAHERADRCESEREKEKWEAYSEGFRHALNIVENLGSAIETYNNIINPSIHLGIITEEGVDDNSYRGH